jgi:hypothetical protein
MEVEREGAEGRKGRKRTYIRVGRIVDAVAGKVVGCTSIGFVGFGLASVEAGREPGDEFGVVSEVCISHGCLTLNGD